ncbi:glycosyltransferase [Bacillus sp. E214]|uniref:glycosyltransferase n=1 Tax=Bacillus sp. E214 TaxID=2587156 RepID=UPI0011DF4628|nr:glycosyltransferase [Bacillus sp. E214]
MNNLAPILLFVYNRPESTLKTIEALKRNKLAKESSLFIFSDGPKNSEQNINVSKVREIINNIQGFKNVEVFISDKNCGLANSVINGVSKIILQYGKVIVLEDDLITSTSFLEYMNKSLQFYQSDINIWSISGYSPKIEFPQYYKSDIYLIPRGCSWGWATWIDRWNSIDWNIEDYQQFKKNKVKRKQFNRAGNDMAKMLEDQIKGTIDSWAIRWCYNQFIQNTYTVYPRYSLIKNIGLEGESTHGSLSKMRDSKMLDNYSFELENIGVSKEILVQFSKHYNLRYYNYVGIFLKRIGLYKRVKQMYKKIQRNKY